MATKKELEQVLINIKQSLDYGTIELDQDNIDHWNDLNKLIIEEINKVLTPKID